MIVEIKNKKLFSFFENFTHGYSLFEKLTTRKFKEIFIMSAGKHLCCPEINYTGQVDRYTIAPLQFLTIAESLSLDIRDIAKNGFSDFILSSEKKTVCLWRECFPGYKKEKGLEQSQTTLNQIGYSFMVSEMLIQKTKNISVCRILGVKFVYIEEKNYNLKDDYQNISSSMYSNELILYT